MRINTDSEEGARDGYRTEHEDDCWDVRDEQACWRRRFLILCGGVVALGVCAWLLPGPHHPSKREAAAASASMDALAKQQALPSAAHGPAWPEPSSMPDVYPTAASASPAKKAGAAHHRQPTAAVSASPSAAKAGACAPADIVLSLFTSKPGYTKGAHPSFSVYAVSTAQAPCMLTYGAGSVRVVVTQHGHVVWNSASCKHTPAQAVRFTLGVPQVLTMVWNPTVKQPAGCSGSPPTGSGATLDAVAMSHGRSSPVRTFKLDQ